MGYLSNTQRTIEKEKQINYVYAKMMTLA